MGKNERRQQIFEVIENQLKQNDPPETRKTYDRLRKEGFDDLVTKQMIGQCVVVELFNILKFGEKYDNERYIKHLSELPEESYDD